MPFSVRATQHNETMSPSQLSDHYQRILSYWWMLELLSPQKVPAPTPQWIRPEREQVIEWTPSDRLPWEPGVLQRPKPVGTTPMKWQHTIYLGVYELDATYERLHRVFGEDPDAYDERPGGQSACASVTVDNRGVMMPDSAVLSSALWAVGRIGESRPVGPDWALGFPAANREFAVEVDKFEGRRREADDLDSAPAHTVASLLRLLQIAHKAAGVSGTPDLASNRIVIKSKAVSALRGSDTPDDDFLNSFYLDDLTTVRLGIARHNGCGAALASYLTPDELLDTRQRSDVMSDHALVDSSVAIERLPKGRWPSKPEYGLALRQQFAVNQALDDLAPYRGLMGVNGPPGTGKTTMLRDILAGNVVERARRLARLPHPEDAFTEVRHRWTSGKHERIVPELRPELTGFEMVVASANNSAVQNVTDEIPALAAIDERWQGKADYFADIATAVLAEAKDTDGGPSDAGPAWGLVAARLGNKGNRDSFRSSFWFDKTIDGTKERVPGTAPRMLARLTEWKNGPASHKTWTNAVADFDEAERDVDRLIESRRQAQQSLRDLPRAINDERRLTEHVAQLNSHLQATTSRLEEHRPHLERAELEAAEAAAARDRCLEIKPGVLETIFTFGRAIREWRQDLQPLDERLRAAEEYRQQLDRQAHDLRDQVDGLHRDLSSTQAERARVSEDVAKLRGRCAADAADLKPAYPDDSWIGETRELHSPWLDAELDAARSDLFLAALQLHQDFLANMASTMIDGLRAALDVVAGKEPYKLEEEKLRAAWQLFFLVVPMVSTTFASFGRMFGNIGPEAIGWLLIDEAGQASPQYAAGAIWRSQRTVVVGDPLQLQPIVTIPHKVQRDVATFYGASATWIPPEASVQTLADRISRCGTTLHQGEQEVWVSAPLTVHRRCDDPMFTLCNEIAYNGIMVNGVHGRSDSPEKPDLFDVAAGPKIKPSQWLDEPALTPGTHLQQNQIARLERELIELKHRGVSMDDVIAISPFRAVSDRLKTLQRAYRGLAAGTIHTAQGREGDVVFLVLGGDPDKPGAKAWASETVNLVNVAASRAKRRLYVVGDRDAWAKYNYFRQLAEALRLAS